MYHDEKTKGKKKEMNAKARLLVILGDKDGRNVNTRRIVVCWSKKNLRIPIIYPTYNCNVRLSSHEEIELRLYRFSSES
jgi:hypothetical protein